jgi:hypothetical protein
MRQRGQDILAFLRPVLAALITRSPSAPISVSVAYGNNVYDPKEPQYTVNVPLKKHMLRISVLEAQLPPL